MKIIFHKYFELAVWITALILLAGMPFGVEAASLCPLHFIGFSYCPGCGLGRSIHYFMLGDLSRSFRMHPLGIPAFFIIAQRIYALLKLHLKSTRSCNKTHTT